MIIEDDLRIAEINRRFLSKIIGFEVCGIATDIQQAKEQLEILEPELALLDVYFPDSSGLELLKYMKQHHPHTDVIMITAAKEVDAVRRAIRGGAFDFIIKPLVFERLRESLEKYSEYRSRLERLQAENGHLSQEQIDLLMVGMDNRDYAGGSYLPKGIDKLTLDKVSAAISGELHGMTADQAAKVIGVSRTTARRYLEHLVSAGSLAADLSYGLVGRPERVYKAVRSRN
ncbi:response regulator [Paenibacillus sp. FJAT-26967]|uniref:response regulator n=1 Tax=Paenibacillus sp. FJAT-26967 TaxID=1729690 RepID=UPI0008389D6A|nr:response regulator [Paenibacillus sp. FJAT-26967]